MSSSDLFRTLNLYTDNTTQIFDLVTMLYERRLKCAMCWTVSDWQNCTVW